MLYNWSLSFPILAGLALFAPGCTTSRYYAPNSMHLPMLTAAREGTVSGGIAKGKNSTVWEIQAAYSPVRHLALMLNHFDARYKGVYNTVYQPPFSFYDLSYSGRSHFTEGGLGAYYQLGPAREYIVSCFGGYGRGSTLNRYSPPPDLKDVATFDASWQYERWFVQPALGLKYRLFHVGTGLRFVWVGYKKGEINSRVGVEETGRIESMQAESPLFLTEIAWTLGLRLRPLLISLNSTAVVRGNENVRQLDLATNLVSLSVGLNLHELRKKKQEARQPKK